MYFHNINSYEELKKRRKELALKYHPDNGGSTEIMQEINAEYDKLSEILKNQKHISSKEYMDYLNELLKEYRCISKQKEEKTQYIKEEQEKEYQRLRRIYELEKRAAKFIMFLLISATVTVLIYAAATIINHIMG
jgi:curved DNA-binding protein CbpA